MTQEESDKLIADIFMRLAEGYQDGDEVMVEGSSLDYLIEAGQCRRIAAFLRSTRPEGIATSRALPDSTYQGCGPQPGNG